jgi:hypothetical protein
MKLVLTLLLAVGSATGLAVAGGLAGHVRARPLRVHRVTLSDEPRAPADEQPLAPADRPGNYVSPYSMALGVSSSAILCSELLPGAGVGPIVLAAGWPTWLGRAAGCTSLPMLVTCFLALRNAAKVGPKRLRSGTYQRLNLALALSSIFAVVLPPRPNLSVTAARAGAALLCLEVWSQSSGTTAGDPLQEVRSMVESIAHGLSNTVHLLRTGGAPVDARRPLAARIYAALSLALGAAAVSSVWWPATTASAMWPVVAPALSSCGRDTAAFSLAAVGAYTLADGAARGRLGASTFVLVNKGMLLWSSAHLAIQVAALGAGAPLGVVSGPVVALVALHVAVFTRALRTALS